MTKKKKLLIFYDWFYPGYRAGGPIQSLTNLTLALIPDFEIYVVTGAYDLNSASPYAGINVNNWNRVLLPAANDPIYVFYAGKDILHKRSIYKLLEEINADVVYLNGIFSYRFFLLPLLCLKKTSKKLKVTVCPRGMLKKGALSGKAFKKKIYLNYLKMFAGIEKIYWHATTPEELADIKKHFPTNKGVLVAPNIPRSPLSNISGINKQAGKLKLVYLSLINEHKNLLLLLQLLKEIHGEVSLDIYGPVVDELYWTKCRNLIKQMEPKVQYKGAVEPANVQDLMSKYNVLILLTKGENFGHALYESLSVGRPVITSDFTPWQHLYEKSAGANVDLHNGDDCIKTIKYFMTMGQEEYNSFCSGAFKVATGYYKKLEAKNSYLQLFM